MEPSNKLDSYSIRNVLRRISMSEKELEAVDKMLALFEYDRANVQKIHEELFGWLGTASANVALNRLISIINGKAKKSGIHIKCCITGDNKVGVAKRWVWFEGPPETPRQNVNELERINNNVIDSEARFIDMLDSNVSDKIDMSRKFVVILTFNEHEKNAVIGKFSPNGTTALTGEVTGLYLGEHGGFNIVLLHSHRQGPVVAQGYATSAWNSWKPVAICSVGIGYGADPKKQSYGDVMISRFVQDCDSEKVNFRGETIRHGGEPYRCSRDLYESIFNLDSQLEKQPTNWPTLYFGQLLSKNLLINNPVATKKLIARYSGKYIIGGEMEGAGLAEAAYVYGFDWILIKGISDFAGLDGDKERNKDERQKTAAKNAVKVIYELLHAEQPTKFHRNRLMQTDSEPKPRTKDLDEAGEIIDQYGRGESLNKRDDPVDSEVTSGGVNVLDAITEWANDSKGQPLFALLGEYGMGKTITCQRFVRAMKEQRKSNSALKLTLYFDLRNVTIPPDKVPTLYEVMLECARRGWESNSESDEALLDRIHKWLEPGAIVVFDGLDEALVKLNKRDGVTFIRTLLSVLDGKKDVKALISTRTQYFRTLRDQRTCLTGEERGNKDENLYQAMIMLPFNEEQVRQYINAAIPDADTGKIEELIESVHNLKDLSKRPYTLRLISGLIPELERMRAQGKPVYGVTLYAEMTKRWLERDWSKNHIKIEDKLSLAAHLAAYLWRKGSSAPAGDIEDWLFEWLESEPRLRRRYEGDSSFKEKLEEELRNSTFLKRTDESRDESVFRFSHTSLLEYFLAVYLYDAARKDFLARWKLPRPSDETLDFLGQLITESNDKQPTKLMQSWAQSDDTEVNSNLLRYALRAKQEGYPYPQLHGIQLPGVNLRLTEITLDLPRAVLDGADFSDASFDGCDLRDASFRGADFTRARVFGCNLERADMSGAKLVGSIFRETALDDARMENSTLHRAKWLWCKGLSDMITDSQQHFITDMQQNNEAFPVDHRTLRSFFSADIINSVAWSHDGSRIASAGDDCTVRIWDARGAGECIAVLEGHTYSINSVAWSPDGSRIASAGHDNTVRIWDARGAGDSIAVLAGHTSSITSVAWSPDGSRIASAGNDNTVRIWDAGGAGDSIAVLKGHKYPINSVTWSPDSSRIASAGDDRTVRIWDAGGTGDSIAVLKGHKYPINSVARYAFGTRAARVNVSPFWKATVLLSIPLRGPLTACESLPLETMPRYAFGTRVARVSASQFWKGTQVISIPLRGPPTARESLQQEEIARYAFGTRRI